MNDAVSSFVTALPAGNVEGVLCAGKWVMRERRVLQPRSSALVFFRAGAFVCAFFSSGFFKAIPPDLHKIPNEASILRAAKAHAKAIIERAGIPLPPRFPTAT